MTVATDMAEGTVMSPPKSMACWRCNQLVIQLYFLEELNLAEIARILDVSVPRVHQIKAQALAELKKYLARLDIDFALAEGAV